MSEQILKALMQLFAIIARPESNNEDRRSVVGSFLERELNEDLVEAYLKIFDSFYQNQQDRKKERGSRVISSSSVRVLKICTQINEELIQPQKIIVLTQLLEFAKSDGDELSEQEQEFIQTVAETFNIPNDEYEHIKSYVISSFEDIPSTSNLLIISNDPTLKREDTKFIYREFINGQIRILNVSSANMYLLRYIGKGEIYLNGQILQQERVQALTVGSSIRNQNIRPIYFSDIVGAFNRDQHNAKISFHVNEIEYRFKNGNIGLHPLSFYSESGHLVGIMGASGAGKSTLLNVLNGSNPPTGGQVLINDSNIHSDKNKIEGLIGHVSQDDLLIEELTVFQNLYYNAKLCFDNYSEEEIVEAVNKTLQNLGLYERKDIQVGSPLNKKISGGQRKRLNIALELIREPAVLFLDEPTSGLSSRDSENIMDLLKELSLKGKLVFVVIHQPSSDIFKMFDKLIILDTGGYLIYNGDPIESITYFKERIHHANWNESECHCCGNVNPEQIFNIVETNVLDEYGKITHNRKITPKEWAKHYKTHIRKNIESIKIYRDLPEISFKIPNKLKQFMVFVQRDVLSKLANTQYLVINLLEAPLLAFLLAFIIKYYNVSVNNKYGYTLEGNSNIPVYIFMAVIVSIFMGLTVSAEEIIKDRKILKREAFLNLSWSSYLFSKVAILFMLSAIQALSFVLIGNSIIEIKGMYFHFWLILFSTWASSNIMGLVISDSFKTVVTIYILIPFLVIPQIVLSGIIVKYEKLNPNISSPSKIPIYGEIMTARWAYEALSVHLFMENKYQKRLYPYDKVMSKAEYKKNYWVPNIENKLDFIRRNYKKAEHEEIIKSHITLIRNEINHENQVNKQVKFKTINLLTYENLNKEIIKNLDTYIEKLKKYFIKLYNHANSLKDKEIADLQKTPEEKEAFLALKRNYNNEQLTEFVENKNEVVRIIEYKDHLYQKTDPIYLDPEFKFLKSHFYAPRKLLINNYIPTYWANLIVIWSMSIFLYLVLYFRLLNKLLDSGEGFRKKFKLQKKEE